MKARTDRDHVRRLQQEGYQVAVSAAYDEQGHPRPSLSAIWRKKSEKMPGLAKVVRSISSRL
jgi:hypothetical protein